MFGPEFFPTPRNIAWKMLAKISEDARNYLEPSAGKGDLAEAIKSRESNRWGGGSNIKVDCIESQPELATILQGKGFPIVGYDWLTYTGVCYYDAIVMNPPYSSGAEHLIRAWDWLHQGEIVCLLNTETLANPCTEERKRLVRIIEEHGNTEHLGNCFKKAERPTDVDVSLVYLKKEAEDDRVNLWATAKPEKEQTGDIGPDEAMLAIRDELGNMEHYYNEATEHWLKAFNHLRKAAVYMEANDVLSRSEYEKIAGLALGNVNTARAEFSRKHRRDSWMRVFDKMHFHKWLDKKQRDEFYRDIETNTNIPFTADNIKGTLENIVLQRGRLFEQSVANVFDELTRHYAGNTISEGWKSNSDYMVNKKLVFPYGCQFRDDSRNGYTWRKFELWYGSSSTIDLYNDLDRILCVLDGRDFESCYTIHGALDRRFRDLGDKVKSPFNNVVCSSYFEIKFWMKGTVHLKWLRPDLWERFNLKASAGKKWVGRAKQEKSA